MPLVLVGIGAVVVVVVLVLWNSGGGSAADGTPTTPAAANAPATPSAAKPLATAPTGTAKAGKTPERPAPPLTADTLNQAARMLEEAKTLCNDGVQARTAGDNRLARERQSLAKDKIDAIKQLIAAPLTWQEEADLGGWAMPAEYGALEKLYGQISTLENRVRKSGGT
ncbi:MAG: hypothetical protein KF830_05350 [Planctomycetes bacterium]|nr:hypothetical protein [Planctomycetota bacterium]